MVGKTSILLICSLSCFSGLAVAAVACQKQSCDIADISRSSGRPFNLNKAMEIKKSYPASAATCIESYYYKLNLPIPEGYKPATKPPAGYSPKAANPKSSSRHIRDFTMSDAAPLIMEREVAQEPEMVREPVEKRQSCKEYAFFWARGTLEPASKNNMGITIGGTMQTALDKAMPGKWHTQGIEYPAALADNFCVGLPGGYNCVQQMNKFHQKCPNTKLALAGFSQGGMVVRNCAAFAAQSAKDKILAVVGIGDPFNGAPVDGIAADKVKSICYAQDGVCGGELAIGLYHGAYMGDNSVKDAVSFITSRAR
jgi:hypothetical protein